jgi:hypothetical protein
MRNTEWPLKVYVNTIIGLATGSMLLCVKRLPSRKILLVTHPRLMLQHIEIRDDVEYMCVYQLTPRPMEKRIFLDGGAIKLQNICVSAEFYTKLRQTVLAILILEPVKTHTKMVLLRDIQFTFV